MRSVLRVFPPLVLLAIFTVTIVRIVAPRESNLGEAPEFSEQNHAQVSSQSDVKVLPDGDEVLDSTIKRLTQADAGTSMDRVPAASGVAMHIVTGEGMPISAAVRIWPITEGLIDALENAPSLGPENMNEYTIEFDLHSESGLIGLNELGIIGECFIRVTAERYQTVGQLASLPINEALTIVMQPAVPIDVLVQDQKLTPLSNLPVTFWNDATDPMLTGMSWREKIYHNFYRERVTTDSLGIATAQTPAPGALNVTCRTQEYCDGSLVGVMPGKQYAMTLYRPCTVKGIVSNERGEPVSDVAVMVSAKVPQGIGSDLGTDWTDQQGAFSLDRVSTAYPVLVCAVVEKGYYSPQRVAMHPKPGEMIMIDLVVKKAVPARLRLILPNGQPADGIVAWIASDYFDSIPGGYLSDENGEIEIGGYLAAGVPYIMFPLSGSTSMRPVRFTIPDAPPYECDVTLHAMGKLRSIKVSTNSSVQLDGEVAFKSKTGTSKYEFRWNHSECSPWLPAGLGVLSFSDATGRRYSHPMNIRSGAIEDLAINFKLAPLCFELPASSTTTTYRIMLSTLGGVDAEAHVLPAGRHAFEVTEGWHILEVQVDLNSVTKFGPFYVDGDGIDLGLLSISAISGTIRGRLHDKSGLPWSGTYLEVTTQADVSIQTINANAEGEFQVDDLPFGSYSLLVSPTNDLFMRYPDIRVPFELSIEAPEKYIELLIEPEGCLIGRIDLRTSLYWGAFRIARDVLETIDVAADGTFLLGNPQIGDLCGAISFDNENYDLFAREIGSIESEIIFRVDSLVSKRIQLIDLAGEAIPYARCQVELNGMALPYPLYADDHGRIRMSYFGDAECVLALSSDNSILNRMRWSDLPVSGSYTVGARNSETIINVVDMSGAPVAAATVTSKAAGFRSVTDVLGEVVLESALEAIDLRAEKIGYWPVVVELREIREVILRKSIPRVLISVPASIDTKDIYVEAQFSLGYDWKVSPRAVESDNSEWVLEHIPEGTYRLSAVDANGVELALAIAELDSREQQRVRLAPTR